MDFCCRVCGNTKFDIDTDYDGFHCSNCGILFVDPVKFTAPKILFRKLNENAIVPTKAHDTDVAYDLYSAEDIYLEGGETRAITTDIAFELPINHEIQVRPRSGLSKLIHVANSPGTVDTGYRGPIKVLLYNPIGNDMYHINKGDRIGQMLITVKIPYVFEEVTELSNTDRGESGFGDSGR